MCFGNVRVVVPCGDGDILVRDLVREAILRYKKATGKVSDRGFGVMRRCGVCFGAGRGGVAMATDNVWCLDRFLKFRKLTPIVESWPRGF